MANGTIDNTVYGPDLSLTPSQQSLLRTALSSNTPDTSVSKGVPPTNISPNDLSAVGSSGNMLPVQHDTGLQSDSIYQSPDLPDSFNLDSTPFIDGHDFEDANFDWDDSEEQLFGDLPGESALGNGIHEKRKNNDDGETEDGKNKRHEGNEKNSKKPGRKPLNSSEPTTKRKAQNRAAQRAFRERKERHLKDLEAKVEDLEKASEATNHENGRLRATVDRLNNEVKEYRQRLSLTAPSYSPPRTQASQRQNQNSDSDFQFAFPRFGDLPGSTFMSNGSLTKTSTSNKGPLRTSSGNVPVVSRAGSSTSSKGKSPTNNGASPANSNMGATQNSFSMGAIQASPTAFQGTGMDDFSGLFSPSIIASVSRNNSTDYTFPTTTRPASSTTKPTEVNSPTDSNPTTIANRASTTSMTGSPSVSSISHAGLDSSCGTTPEPSADTQDQRKPSEGTLRTINEESTLSSDEKRKFCGKWANSCGDSTNPVPRDLSQPESGIAPSSNVAMSPIADINGIDWMARQNGGQFDPVFGDYRDTHNDLFSNDFFSDAFLSQDFSTPFNVPEDISPVEPTKEPKKNLMQQVEERQNADYDEVVPGNATQFLRCDKLWLVSALAFVHGSINLLRDRLQHSEKAQSGDIEGLCAQLKAKAKCSGTGPVIEQKDVDAILGPPPDEQRDFLKMFK
ncbi:hypothetical protein Q9189_006080 [Teloschistes chrysophthalmus]